MGRDAADRWAEEEWAVLSQEEHDRQVTKAFERLALAKGRRFKKAEYQSALEDVFMKVSAEFIPHMKTLARLSATMLAEDRIKDEQVLKTFSASSDPENSFMLLWANPFDKIHTALENAYSRGPLTQEDFIYRLWVVYGRVAAFIQEFLEVEGWTDDFAPALVAYQDGQINLAIKTPTNQPLPSLSLGEILAQRK